MGLMIHQIRQKLERKKGNRDQVIKGISDSKKKIKKLESEISYFKKAQDIITAVAKTTQEELQYKITEPVSLALSSVYDNPYKMVADFKIAGRGTTECYLKFKRNGNFTKPFDSSGGGPIDVTSFALRIGAWNLKKPKLRPVIILDEPGKFISRDKIALFGQMIKETSKNLGIQIIMISHINELINCADKCFGVKLINGVSKVRKINS